MLLLLLVVVVGVVGYVHLEGYPYPDAAWMVFITLTTIGYGEVHPLSGLGRLFSVGLVLSGLTLGSYAVSQLSLFITDGGLQRAYEERRRRVVMAELHLHFIVAGFGRTGREIAHDLRHAGKRVVVIDPEAPRCDECRSEGFAAIQGDASHDEVLVQAGIERAKGIAVATSSDAVNIFVTLSARQLNPKIRIMTRVDEEHSAQKALRAGADGIVSPHAIGGSNMAHALLRPHSATFMAQAFGRMHPELSMEDVLVGEDPSFHGRLSEIKLRANHHVIIVAIQKANGTLVTAPGPSYRLAKGDVIVAVGAPARIAELRAALSPTEGDSAA